MIFSNLFNKSNIDFSCTDLDWDVIAKPYPARKFIPDWFKALPMTLGPEQNVEDRFDNSTIKKCVPFLDAMTAGYIIPLAADVEIQTNDDASGVTWYSKFYKPLVETHNKDQITTSKSPNPMSKFPPIKFLNYWYVKTPPGWSTLFVPPINRPDSRFVCYAGLVDTDSYTNFINFPFFFTQSNFVGILKAGTPLVQAIPIKRDTLKYNVRTLTNKEEDVIGRFQSKLRFHKGLYRDEMVVKK